jgi:hypothetical protein
VTYRNSSWARVNNVRSRSVFEMETCVVFTPDNPNLYSLNSTAWLVFELCNGRSFGEINKSYYEAVEPLRSPEEATDDLIEILIDLENKGILERTEDARPI